MGAKGSWQRRGEGEERLGAGEMCLPIYSMYYVSYECLFFLPFRGGEGGQQREEGRGARSGWELGEGYIPICMCTTYRTCEYHLLFP